MSKYKYECECEYGMFEVERLSCWLEIVRREEKTKRKRDGGGDLIYGGGKGVKDKIRTIFLISHSLTRSVLPSLPRSSALQRATIVLCRAYLSSRKELTYSLPNIPFHSSSPQARPRRDMM